MNRVAARYRRVTGFASAILFSSSREHSIQSNEMAGMRPGHDNRIEAQIASFSFANRLIYALASSAPFEFSRLIARSTAVPRGITAEMRRYW
jgi:hypothetical protein